MGKGPQSNMDGIRNLSSVPRLCRILSKFGHIFELLLLPEFTMDLFDTYIYESMDIGTYSNTARIKNLSFVPRLCPNLNKSLTRYSSVNLQWISLKLIWMNLWQKVFNQIRPELGICPLFPGYAQI